MSSALSAVPLRRPAGWHVCLAAAPVVIAVYYTLVHLGASPGLQVALYSSANTVFAVCALLAARRNPALRATMVLLAGSGLAGVAGDVLFYFEALVNSEVPYPGVPDFFYLAAYPLMAAGLLLIVRRRTPGWGGASGVDAAIVAVGAGYLVYEFVIAPTWSVDADNLTRFVSVAYPLGDLMLIMVGARLMLGAGPRTTSLRLVGGYLALTLYADTMYSVQSLDGSYHAGNYLDVFWITAGFMMAAAVLHPRAAQLVSPSSAATPDATTGRLLVLALAAMTAPTALLILQVSSGTAHVTVAAIVCNVLFLLVMVRMTGLVRAQRQAAITDGLTGLRSRRYFEEALSHEGSRVARQQLPLSMLLLDIDHFKVINDTYGHNGGDRVLVEVTNRVRELIRPGDVVARYGGEEFAVLLPNTGAAQAREVAERIRGGVAAAPIAVADSQNCRITVSVGIAGMAPDGSTAGLVLAADRALYAAKDAGRNRVSVA